MPVPSPAIPVASRRPGRSSLRLSLLALAVLCSAPTAFAQFDASYSCSSTSALPGGDFGVSITIATDTGITAFSGGLLPQAGFADFTDVILGPALDSAQGGIDPDFSVLQLVAGPDGTIGLTFAAIIDFSTTEFLAAEAVHEVVGGTGTVNPDALAGIWSLEFVDTLEPNPGVSIDLAVSFEGPGNVEATPTVFSGSVVVETAFVRGDVNEDGQLTLNDVLLHLFIIFGLTPPSQCDRTLDINADGVISLTDPLYLIQFLYQSGPPPFAPFPSCGFSTLPVDIFTCTNYEACP